VFSVRATSPLRIRNRRRSRVIIDFRYCRRCSLARRKPRGSARSRTSLLLTVCIRVYYFFFKGNPGRERILLYVRSTKKKTRARIQRILMLF